MSIRPIIKYSKNDTGPSLIFIFYRTNAAGTRSAVDITGATVVATVKQEYLTTSKFQNTCTNTDPTNGKTRLDFVAGDWDTAGNFAMEIEITYSGGQIETAPVFPLIEVTNEFPDPV